MAQLSSTLVSNTKGSIRVPPETGESSELVLACWRDDANCQMAVKTITPGIFHCFISQSCGESGWLHIKSQAFIFLLNSTLVLLRTSPRAK